MLWSTTWEVLSTEKDNQLKYTAKSSPCPVDLVAIADQLFKAADVVVSEIRAVGGRAVANYDSVESGGSIIDTAIKEYGRIDVLLNNAGILRDVSFKNMTDDDWDLTIKVHVNGSYKVKSLSYP